ncbi:uncharacterized protein LOC62_07G009551 [Vanrija pseudolonga]|uniref:Uncharacterized protein n=1 Tax=Vanrija pseudolonga TaxID=143232 RepID=A0AAF0YM61_9TREE|nr:hypothetical protein LOC62_07G009551 [Vanrija pseudolonga]
MRTPPRPIVKSLAPLPLAAYRPSPSPSPTRLGRYPAASLAPRAASFNLVPLPRISSFASLTQPCTQTTFYSLHVVVVVVVVDFTHRDYYPCSFDDLETWPFPQINQHSLPLWAIASIPVLALFGGRIWKTLSLVSLFSKGKGV